MRSVIIFLCCHGLAVTLSAISFNFQFLNGGTQVGDGNVSLAVDPGLGEFPLSAQDFTLEFDLGAYGLFEEADIQNLSTANILLTEIGGVRRLQFSGDGGTMFGGSLDLFNGTFGLTFEPSAAAPSPEQLDEYLIADNTGFIDGGRYLALAIPDPGSTAPLLLAGMSVLVCASTVVRGRRPMC